MSTRRILYRLSLAGLMLGLVGIAPSRGQIAGDVTRTDRTHRSDSHRLMTGDQDHLRSVIETTQAGSVSYFQLKPMPAMGNVVYGPGVSFVHESFDPFDLTFELEGGTQERLFFELQAGGWGGNLISMQVTVDWQSSYASGSGADLQRPVIACDPNDATNGEETCRLALGRGSLCRADSPSPPVYPPNSCRDAFANGGLEVPLGTPGEPDPNFINPCCINEINQRFMLYGRTDLGGPGALDVGQIGYVGALAVDVPADAAGTYTLDLVPEATSMLVDGDEIVIQELRPGIIHIASGRCCVPATNECLDNATQISCDAAGGTFVLDGTCTPGVCCEEAITGPDCNNNGVLDVCDLEDLDCNGNNQPDDCDVTDGFSADCNGNGVPDECDAAGGASADCNGDGIPDECQPAEDCNSTGVTDICDIGAGTSADCNADLVPDECQPDEDCNSNGTTDICDIGAGISIDCNANLVPDDCDVAGGFSPDANGDGVPDECCVSPAVTFVGPEKSRYLSMSSIGTPGVRSGVAVIFGPNESYPEFLGQALWVGPPQEYPEDDSSDPTRTFTGASLTCEPHYQDWSGIDTLHVFGPEIVPNSQYAVLVLNEGCPTTSADNFSPPTQIDTSAFGDVVAPFFPLGLPQPNFQDVSAFVARFLDNPGAPIKASAQLVPNVLAPVDRISFRDVNAVAQSFLGGSYLDIVPDAQACACPSAVTCGATPCTADVQCADGFCVNGFCTDACHRCAP